LLVHKQRELIKLFVVGSTACVAAKFIGISKNTFTSFLWSWDNYHWCEKR